MKDPFDTLLLIADVVPTALRSRILRARDQALQTIREASPTYYHVQALTSAKVKPAHTLTLKPSVPRTPYKDDNDDVTEDDFTPRVSLAPSVELAIQAVEEHATRYFAVYETASDLDVVEPHTTAPNGEDGPYFQLQDYIEQLSEEDEDLDLSGVYAPSHFPDGLRENFEYFVPDAADTQEVWSLTPVKVKYVGVYDTKTKKVTEPEVKAANLVSADNVMTPTGIEPGVAVDDDEDAYEVLVNNADTVSTMFENGEHTDAIAAAEALPTTFAATLRHLDALTLAIPVQEGDEDDNDKAFEAFRDSLADIRGAVEGMMTWAHKLKELSVSMAPTSEPKFPSVPKPTLPAAEAPAEETEEAEEEPAEPEAEEEESSEPEEDSEPKEPAEPKTLDDVADLL